MPGEVVQHVGKRTMRHETIKDKVPEPDKKKYKNRTSGYVSANMPMFGQIDKNYMPTGRLAHSGLSLPNTGVPVWVVKMQREEYKVKYMSGRNTLYRLHLPDYTWSMDFSVTLADGEQILVFPHIGRHQHEMVLVETLGRLALMLKHEGMCMPETTRSGVLDMSTEGALLPVAQQICYVALLLSRPMPEVETISLTPDTYVYQWSGESTITPLYNYQNTSSARLSSVHDEEMGSRYRPLPSQPNVKYVIEQPSNKQVIDRNVGKHKFHNEPCRHWMWQGCNPEKRKGEC